MWMEHYVRAKPCSIPFAVFKHSADEHLHSSGEPQNYMFREMRAALDIPKTVDILDHIYALPTAEAQEEAHEKIRAIERRAMVVQQPQAGLLPLMDYLQSRGMPVQHLLGKFLVGYKFEPVITRDFRPPKPHPAGILHIAKSWGLEDGGSRLIMVGDSIDDMTAGHEAGAATVLLANDANAHLAEHQHTDLVISRLDELIEILEGGFVGNGNSEETKPGEQV